MKPILLAVCLTICALSPSHSSDLFAPPQPKANADNEFGYKTSAGFLDATRSGEVPQKIQNMRDYKPLASSVADILQESYGYPNRRPGSFTGQSFYGPELLELLTKYEFAKDDKTKARIELEFKNLRQHVQGTEGGPNLMTALDAFLKDYSRALKEHIALNKDLEAQQMAAETERQRQADMVAQNAQDERRQAMATTNAKVASARAEDEMRAAAVREAMEEQAKIKNQKLQEILASPAYSIWQVSLQIEEGLRMVKKGEQILAKEDAIVRESGITDKLIRRQAGEEIVAGKAMVDKAFASYKKLGGKANVPADVKAGEDPAHEFR